jgi:hypothetical protein
MTLICVRLDNSHLYPRLTALADTRASALYTDKTRRPISDTTVKLFAVETRCYDVDTLSPTIGAWHDPYFTTLTGLGFSGDCFEGLTVIAHVSQMLGALVTESVDKPLPSKEGLVNLIARITEKYFEAHSGTGKPELHLVIFGFEEERPWIGKVSWDPKNKLSSSIDWADETTLVAIGDTASFESDAERWRKAIQKHRRKVAANPVDQESCSEKELEIARHELAEKK